jgi:hypothetical protein
MAVTARPGEPADDYLIDTGAVAPQVPMSYRILRLLQGIMLVVIAALSLAIFWLVGLLIGVF